MEKALQLWNNYYMYLKVNGKKNIWVFFSFISILLRSKLTSDAEKESVMMFGRNLRQLLLTSPVRGRALMGVDPGYKHGCKLAIISPTSKFQFQTFLEGLIKTHSFRVKIVSKPTFLSNWFFL